MTRTPVEDLTPSAEAEENFVPVDERDREFGRYLLRYEVGSGGMATVYLARARGPGGFDRPLAIKRIHPHLAKKTDFVEMFLDEARLSAKITHPNVCSVFEFGEVDGTYFMAMEYLVGRPLSAVLRTLQKRPEIGDSSRWHALAAKIIADAAEGLHAAHELRDENGELPGVVHRDVTPHNIFVTYDGAVKVVDFGVAWAEGRLHQTQSGTLKGKLGYMSPEQVRGKGFDRRLDVWALGICLWELLALRRLFPKYTEVELIDAVVHQPILPRPPRHPSRRASLGHFQPGVRRRSSRSQGSERRKPGHPSRRRPSRLWRGRARTRRRTRRASRPRRWSTCPRCPLPGKRRRSSHSFW